MKDYYKILGLKQEASAEDIKVAYHDMAKRYHPDTVKRHREVALRRFQALGEAYETLKTPETRAKYDRLYLRELYKMKRTMARHNAENDNKAIFPFPWEMISTTGWRNLSRLFKDKSPKDNTHGQ